MSAADSAAYYSTLAGASAAVYGIGPALLAGRFVELAERVAALELGRSDEQNTIGRGATGGLENVFRSRARTAAIADLAPVAQQIRWAIIGPVVAAVLLVAGCLAPLGDFVDDSRGLRVGLLVAFLVTGAAWLVIIHYVTAGLIDTTRRAHLNREGQRAKDTAEGKDFLVSGDPNKLAADMAAVTQALGGSRRQVRRAARLAVRRRPPP